jgi:undecaprenyl-diphosphatase
VESGWTQDLLNWIAENPGWSGLLIFLIAFIESLLVIGFFIPGIFILFGVGAIVGMGGLDVTWIWLGGSVGAFCGDILSYWIGHRYRRQLADFWPFRRYPEMLQRGSAFFNRHGAKSVLAGRFIGPLRPIIPATAGMLGMTPARFVAVCVPACILWTPAYLLPGMLFGASLEVAAEYAGRLTLLLAALCWRCFRRAGCAMRSGGAAGIRHWARLWAPSLTPHNRSPFPWQ